MTARNSSSNKLNLSHRHIDWNRKVFSSSTFKGASTIHSQSNYENLTTELMMNFIDWLPKTGFDPNRRHCSKSAFHACTFPLDRSIRMPWFVRNGWILVIAKCIGAHPNWLNWYQAFGLSFCSWIYNLARGQNPSTINLLANTVFDTCEMVQGCHFPCSTCNSGAFKENVSILHWQNVTDDVWVKRMWMMHGKSKEHLF